MLLFNHPARNRRPLTRHVPFALALLSVAFICNVPAQQKNKKNAVAAVAPAAPLLTRTMTKHEVRRFSYGGTLTLVGAPAGSIVIEAWPRSEVDITAEVELRAETEEDLTRLAEVNKFVLDEDADHLSILTTGTHDKAYMRRAAKDFPKKLLGLPWKINYRIRVPAVIDLEVDAGRGPFDLAGVEGLIKFNALESDATLILTGGAVKAVIGQGKVNVILAARSWRGSGADIQLATGDLNVTLPPNFSAEINATILRTGSIENSYPTLTPRERVTNTDHSLQSRAGAGGASLSFTVGDGKLRIKKQ